MSNYPQTQLNSRVLISFPLFSTFFRALVHNYPESGLGVYVTTDGVVYKDQVEEAATLKKSNGFGHLLILVTIRLGIDKLNPIYNDAVKATFEFPQTLGIAGYVVRSDALAVVT